MKFVKYCQHLLHPKYLVWSLCFTFCHCCHPISTVILSSWKCLLFLVFLFCFCPLSCKICATLNGWISFRLLLAVQCRQHPCNCWKSVLHVSFNVLMFLAGWWRGLMASQNTIQYNTKFVKRHVPWLQRRWRKLCHLPQGDPNRERNLIDNHLRSNNWNGDGNRRSWWCVWFLVQPCVFLSAVFLLLYLSFMLTQSSIGSANMTCFIIDLTEKWTWLKITKQI